MSAPRHVPTTHRRAPRSSTTGNEGRFPHTTESEADLATLLARWGLSTAATCRRALAECRAQLVKPTEKVKPTLLSAEEMEEILGHVADALGAGVRAKVEAHIAALEAGNAEVVDMLRHLIAAVDKAGVRGSVLAVGPALRRIAADHHPGAHLLAEHTKALEAAAFRCCGGSDEHPPTHTQDCPVLVRARNDALEAGCVAIDEAFERDEDVSPQDVLRAMKEPES